MARDVLAPLLGKFISANPTLRVSLDVYSSGYEHEPGEDVDIYFKIRTPTDSTRRIRRYPGTTRGLFASPGYVSRFGSPSDPAALSAHICIGSSPEQRFYPWKLHRGKKTVTPELKFQVMTTDPEVHRRLALDGVGITILPIWICLLYTSGQKFTGEFKSLIGSCEASHASRCV